MPEEKLYAHVKIALENDILSGLIREDEMVPSTNRYAEYYQINPATAAKGVAQLTAEGVLYKKRGIGLFVSPGAREKIMERRRDDFRPQYLTPLLEEAHRLGISRQDLVAMMIAAEK